jgi:hypothetical protein
MTLWPSGLRRYVKAVVFTGGGSNPPEVTFSVFALIRPQIGTLRVPFFNQGRCYVLLFLQQCQCCGLVEALTLFSSLLCYRL